MKTFLNALLLCVFLIVAGDAYADIEVANVVFASGEVKVVDIDSRKRYVIKGDLIFPGETLVTGEGRVQVKFTDDGRVSLKPNTIYSISDYYYDESEDEPVKSFFELVTGTIRFVSGKIGKRDRTAFGIKTNTATIGIRGSSGQVTSCLNSGCPGRLDGTYLTTYQGVLTISSAGSTLDVHPNETAFCGADASGCSKIDQPTERQVDTFTPGIGPSYQQGEQVGGDHGHAEPAAPPPVVPAAPSGGYSGGNHRY